jgi:hypothetical protein
MRRPIPAIFFITALVPRMASAQRPSPPAPPAPVSAPSPLRATVADLAWLAGHWRDETATDLSEEVWSAPHGDSMLGMWRWASKGQARVIELLMVRQEGDGVAFRFRHFDGTLKAWEDKDAPFVLPMIRGGPSMAVFQGRSEKGGLLRLTYTREGDALVAVLEKDDQKPQTFRFRRAAP